MIIAGDAEDEAKALCEDARRGVRIDRLIYQMMITWTCFMG